MDMASRPAKNYWEVRSLLEGVFADYALLLDGLSGTSCHANTIEPRFSIEGNLQNFAEAFRRIEDTYAPKAFSVAVLALAKSGKSTLINSLLGDDILPSSNVPETARICRVVHANAAKVSLQDDAYTLEGSQTVRDHLRSLNHQARENGAQRLTDGELVLRAPVRALASESAHNSTELHIFDTPGPNEAGQENLRYEVERLLEHAGAVLYLLDYTKLKTREEADMFDRLKGINPNLVRHFRQRLFFVVNKKDVMEQVDGMDEQQTKVYVSQLVTRQLQGDDHDFHLEPSRVLVLSARHALCARLVMSSATITPARLKSCARLAFGEVGSRHATPEMTQSAAEEMLQRSGIEQLEQTVLGFLYEHSGWLHLMASTDDMCHHLQQVHNVCGACHVALRKDATEVEREMDVLRARFATTMERFATVQGMADRLEHEVTLLVRQRILHLKKGLICQLNIVLDPSNPPTDGSSWKSGKNGCRSKEWMDIWKAASALFHTERQAAPRSALEADLRRLYTAVNHQINAEVREFWHEMEIATNERQRAFIQEINGALAELSAEVEATVEEQLGSVTLEPVRISLVPPTITEHHTHLTELLRPDRRGAGPATAATSSHPGEVAHGSSGREARAQCGSFQSVGRTAQGFCSRIIQHLSEAVYSDPVHIEASNVRRFFVELIEEMSAESCRGARGYIRKGLAGHVARGRELISTYCELYVSCKAAAVDVQQQGEQQRKQHMSTIGTMQDTLRRLQSEIVDHCTRGSAALAMNREVAEELPVDDHFTTDSDDDLVDVVELVDGLCFGGEPKTQQAFKGKSAMESGVTDGDGYVSEEFEDAAVAVLKLQETGGDYAGYNMPADDGHLNSANADDVEICGVLSGGAGNATNAVDANIGEHSRNCSSISTIENLCDTDSSAASLQSTYVDVSPHPGCWESDTENDSEQLKAYTFTVVEAA
ncbi:hypothetical protein CYMTET_52497 [Cymbomonas tetramitiformis]|uniref:Dynamin N-terminal domain-containing protein n=1 Tax=Cymbomonas tetramitiformis TaxID=36881 RepID=A0AAE0ERK7_9CHLO|nr:hypothetical protein CYMTET_52497 [Cymbomonas tetramitiformis]